MGCTHSKNVFPSYVSCIVQMKLDPFGSVCSWLTRLVREVAQARPESKIKIRPSSPRESKRDELDSNLGVGSKDSSVKGRAESIATRGEKGTGHLVGLFSSCRKDRLYTVAEAGERFVDPGEMNGRKCDCFGLCQIFRLGTFYEQYGGLAGKVEQLEVHRHPPGGDEGRHWNRRTPHSVLVLAGTGRRGESPEDISSIRFGTAC